MDFIDNLALTNYHGNYAFAVITCGSNIGNAMKLLSKHLEKKGVSLHSGFSLVMPNNYIIMGDVDSKEREREKLIAAVERLEIINQTVAHRTKDVFDVVKGAVPWLLTSFVNPLFNKNAIDASRFHVTDNCTGCGICAKVCNTTNIVVDGKPTWGNRCTQCLACINHCPERAIQYAKGTEKKGRYTNPNVSVEKILQGQ